MTSFIQFQQATYLTSATTVAQLVSDQDREVAFMGRSNAGKSSALNAIAGIKKLARTSRTPGRTQMINFFALDASHRLVDLPGYGFAKTPLRIKLRWEKLISNYLEIRQSLVGLMLVMDSRHPLKEMDQQFMEWAIEFEVPLHILLTKSDKLSGNEQKKSLFLVENSIAMHKNISVQLFSSVKKHGVDEAREKLKQWFR